MDPGVPSKQELQEQAQAGRPITQAEASTIAANETDLTGNGPIKGGAAATAQSLHDKQQNFFNKAGSVARKPGDQITSEDARQVQSAEARVEGGNLSKGSQAADVQAIAARNEQGQ